MSRDDVLLDEARHRWQLASDAQQKQREREADDLRFYAGDQWPSDILLGRKGVTVGAGSSQQSVPARPSLVINKCIEPVRQVLSQERESDFGYELVPADDFGEVTGPIDHAEIELREGLVRRIQRDSEAEDARTWSFMRAAIAGRGWRLVNTRYLPGKRSDQELYIERIYDQTSVLLDPSHQQADGSDAEWAFYGTDLLWEAFKAEYPKAKVSKIRDDADWRTLVETIPGWFRDDGPNRAVRVMNYYYIERTDETLYHLSDGSACTAEERDTIATQRPGVTLVRDEDGQPQSHVETRRTVQWCKLVGDEVLERTTWPGRWIPIIQEVGEELQPYDQERRYQGVVRPMRDACQGNNYIVSKFVERVGLTAIPPIMMAGGQDEGWEAEWDASNTRTLSRLHYNQKDHFDQPAPPPFKPPSASSDVADLAMGVQLFGQAIQSTSAVPETALGNTDATVKSGKLARALIEQADRSTSQFMDNHKRSLRHEARVINDLLYPIYGRPGRMLKIVNGQGETESMLGGLPFTMEGQGKQRRPVPVAGYQPGQPLPPQAKLVRLTPDADFNVAVKITRSIETRRQQIAEFLGQLVGASPEQMAVIGDKLWQYLDVPDHAEIEERYKVMLAPPIQKLLAGNTPLPPEAQQQIAMLEQQLQQILPLADKNRADLEKTKIQESEETKRVQMKQVGDDARTRADNETKLAVAELGAKVDRLALFLEERARLGLQAQEGTESELTRQHERQMAMLEHQQALQQAAQGHQQALQQQDQQHAGALVQQDAAHQQALEQQAAAPAAP